MSQENINYGAFPDDPSADAIRTAFEKVQNNFTQIFNNIDTGGVTSINKNPGAGITVSQPTGNVIVSANIATITVLSNTLSLGLNTINRSNPNSNSTTPSNVFISSSTTLLVDLPNEISNITAIRVNGNITSNNANLGNLAAANFFQGDGGLLTNVSANGTLINGTSSVTIPVINGNVNTSVNGISNVFVVTTTGANVIGTFTTTGNISGSNLTTNGSLNVTGNANVGNIGAGIGLFTGNISAINANLGNQAIANFFTGTLTTAAQLNITSVGTLTGLNVSGNIVAANITVNPGIFAGNGSGLSNLEGGNVIGQVANSLVSGTVYTNSQPNITSVGTLTSLGVTGNVTSGNVYANSGTIGASLLTGTLTTASQPNITSIGTLSSLSVTGNVTAGNIVGIFANGNSNISIPAANGNITFATAGSERMRISNTGAVTINQPSSGNALTVNGNLQTTGNITTSNYLINSVQTGISASGSTQGTATVLGNTINVVSIVSSGANGVRLPTAIAGMTIYITNTTANSLNVYPDSGASINFSSINVPLSQGANSTIHYIASSPTRWYSVGATYA